MAYLWDLCFVKPRMTVECVKEFYHPWDEKWCSTERKTQELLEIVGIRKEEMDKYPHEFSSGQRQSGYCTGSCY